MGGSQGDPRPRRPAAGGGRARADRPSRRSVLAVVGAPIGPAGDANCAGRSTSPRFCSGFVAQIAINRLAIGPSVTVGEAIAPRLRALDLRLFGVLVLVHGRLLVDRGRHRHGPGRRQADRRYPRRPPAAGLASSLLLLIIVLLAFAIFQLVFPLAAVETGNPLRSDLRGAGSWARALSAAARLRPHRLRRGRRDLRRSISSRSAA